MKLLNVPYTIVGNWRFTRSVLGIYEYVRTCRGLIKNQTGDVVAFWGYPAGITAYLSGRPYTLVLIGVDVYTICGSRLWSWLYRPVLNKAKKLIFIGPEPRKAFGQRYGKRYSGKMRECYFPVGEEYTEAARSL